MRMVFIKTLLLSLVSLASHAFAQSADKPEIHVGDRWSWQHTNAMVNEKDFTRIEDVFQASEKEVRTRTRIKGKDGSWITIYTPEWNPIDITGARFDPSLKRFDFPLQVGKKWSGVTDKMLFSNGNHGKWFFKNEIVTFEKVIVPAGTFDAYKIVFVQDAVTTDENANTGKTVETHWYAPSVRNDVKIEMVFTKDGEVRSKNNFELLEFTLR